MTSTEVPFEETRRNAEAFLLAELQGQSHWAGELSPSALATAVAVFALWRVDRSRHAGLVDAGVAWLMAHVNADGGWGDTPESESNLSTTVLCWSVLSALQMPGAAPVMQRSGEWIQAVAGGSDPESLVRAVLASYGNDRTFSAPILSLCGLTGVLGEGEDAWRRVPQLPFEVAVLPHRFYRWLQLPVVSYALPALIAIGLLRHRKCPVLSPLRASWRDRLQGRLLGRLSGLQPGNGGFLEAVPLTAFVCMSLAGAGFGDHEVVRRGIRFLVERVRSCGAWAIDTDLATWNTTLAVNALAADGRDPRLKLPAGCDPLSWLAGQQYRVRHPFTDAAPGGWAWTDLPGGVPDADDTSGALLAIRQLSGGDPKTADSARLGIDWLLGLQNRDGGWPTFCRGWGKLPFDRSCPDITAHVLSAFDAWYEVCAPAAQSALDAALASGVEYLAASRDDDGAWEPLWFGNQNAPGKRNRVYGTSRVIRGLVGITPERLPEYDYLVEDACEWLRGVQNGDGGWGGERGVSSSIEETAVAVEALAMSGHADDGCVQAAVAWLAERTDLGTRFDTAPIGLYFARLWYAERLYPAIFTVAALNRVAANRVTRGLTSDGCDGSLNP